MCQSTAYLTQLTRPEQGLQFHNIRISSCKSTTNCEKRNIMNLLITLYQEAPNLERQLLAGTADITVFGVGEGECWWGAVAGSSAVYDIINS